MPPPTNQIALLPFTAQLSPLPANLVSSFSPYFFTISNLASTLLIPSL